MVEYLRIKGPAMHRTAFIIGIITSILAFTQCSQRVLSHKSELDFVYSLDSTLVKTILKLKFVSIVDTANGKKAEYKIFEKDIKAYYFSQTTQNELIVLKSKP